MAFARRMAQSLLLLAQYPRPAENLHPRGACLLQCLHARIAGRAGGVNIVDQNDVGILHSRSPSGIYSKGLRHFLAPLFPALAAQQLCAPCAPHQIGRML